MRVLKYIVVNALIIYCTYLALFDGVVGAQRLITFIAGFFMFVSFLLHTDVAQSKLKEVGRSIPASIDLTIDVSLIACFVWFGFILTAIMWAIHTTMVNTAYSSALDNNAKTS